MTNFRRMLEKITSKHVYIQTHNFPDPDAIASAFGMKVLLETEGIEASICYKGSIDRFSTKRMIQCLDIEMINIKDISDMNEEEEVILVDSQRGNANTIDLAGNRIICIDHHPIFVRKNYLFQDIRPEAGACASIIAEYILENHIEIPKKLATALLYGIKVDTANLSRGVSELDLDIFYLLYQKSDLEVINNLEHCTLQLQDLQAYANAIQSIKVYDVIGFANTGDNCPEALIATISDFMLALAEVDISIVYSLQADGIKISVRSEVLFYDAGKITNMALRELGSGGGHPSMAGGFVPYAGFKEELSKMIAVIESNFIRATKEYTELCLNASDRNLDRIQNKA